MDWRYILLIFFMVPLIEAGMAIIGTLHSHNHYKSAPWKFSRAIIQITTVGKEADLIRQTIKTVRGYDLKFPYEIWVVNEPGFDNDYPLADRVITVPADFECKPINKARALEFSRRIRAAEGFNRADVKIILMDDDSIPTREYFQLAFQGDYDLCQGATVANRYYAQVNWKHAVLSHVDNIRVRNCMIYCSFTQGVTTKPLFVHGEGLTMTGLVEDKITWDHPIIASDDLVFGTRAAAEGFSWGYFNAAIQIISPWTFTEAWKQRKRWTWGNISAIISRDILPLSVAIPKALKYAVGAVSIFTSTIGAALLYTGVIEVPPAVHDVYRVSLICWFASYGVAAWVNTSGVANRSRFYKPVTEETPGRGRHSGPPLQPLSAIRYYGWRLLQSAIGTITCPLVSAVPVFIILSSLLTGKPKSFIMIDKTIPGLVEA